MNHLKTPEMSKWSGSLRAGIDSLTADLDAHNQRLIAQRALLGLVALIDP